MYIVVMVKILIFNISFFVTASTFLIMCKFLFSLFDYVELMYGKIGICGN